MAMQSRDNTVRKSDDKTKISSGIKEGGCLAVGMDLPAELLTHVFDYLPRADLVILRLTCLLWYRVARPLIGATLSLVNRRGVDVQSLASIASYLPHVKHLKFDSAEQALEIWSMLPKLTSIHMVRSYRSYYSSFRGLQIHQVLKDLGRDR